MIKPYPVCIVFIALLMLTACDPNHYVAPETGIDPETGEPSDEPLLGKGVFTYDAYEPLGNKPINVYYYVPASADPDSPIVFVFHGTNRNAEDYRDTWISKAEQYNLMVFAPEYRSAFFPGSSGYNLGNVFTNGENPSEQTLNDSSIWTFSTIEPMFDSVISRTSNNSETYHLFGHSAGGQFVHRFVLFNPGARFGTAIASNSGWYTLPDATIEFPYGLGVTPLENGSKGYFSRNLIIQIGELDNDPESAALRHTEEADAQGLHRYDRAYYFYEQSANLAATSNQSFEWKIIEVPNTGHDKDKTSMHAADYLFE